MTIYSHSNDVTAKSVRLHVDSIDMESTSYISADVLQIIALQMKLELDSKITLSARGYAAGSGPGRASCGTCAGAGHGGKGGVGYKACGSCYSG